MFPLPLPAAARVTLRRLGVRRLWDRGLSTADMTKGLVLGIYSKDKEDDIPQFTSAGESFNKLVAGKLREMLNISGPPLKAGKTRNFYGLHEDFPSVVVVGLGKRSAGFDEKENWNEGKENIRAAIAAECRQVQDLELPSVEVDTCGDAQAAAEGAVLGLYEFDDLKQKRRWLYQRSSMEMVIRRLGRKWSSLLLDRTWPAS
ncbi:hypothetical protein ACRRTK_020493 [Alexandromys fortis]